VLAPIGGSAAPLPSTLPASLPIASVTSAAVAASSSASAGRHTAGHTVRRGESAWAIARRYGLKPEHLLKLNKLPTRAVLRPGMVLRLVEAEQ
jgi:membrane-bound lytic murein transglycosylase D